jgi:hypothetical protein
MGRPGAGGATEVVVRMLQRKSASAAARLRHVMERDMDDDGLQESGNRDDLPRANEALLPPLFCFGRHHGLGNTAEPVSPLRWSAARSLAFPAAEETLPYWRHYVVDSIDPARYCQTKSIAIFMIA